MNTDNCLNANMQLKAVRDKPMKKNVNRTNKSGAETDLKESVTVWNGEREMRKISTRDQREIQFTCSNFCYGDRSATEDVFWTTMHFVEQSLNWRPLTPVSFG